MDLTSPAGKMTVGIISHMAEFELDLPKERTQAGLARAKAEGTALGRRSSLADADKADVLAKRAAGASLGELAKTYGVSRSAIQRIEKKAAA